MPDAPVSKFVIQLKGGQPGLIENSVNLRKSTPKADVRRSGRTGRCRIHAEDERSCGKKEKK